MEHEELIPMSAMDRMQRKGPAQNLATMAEIISALSFALDLTEGAVPGHALRSCLLSMSLAAELGLAPDAAAALHSAALLKDVGCSSNASRMCGIIGGGDDRAVKAGVKLEDWTQPHKPRLSTLRLLWKNVNPGSGPVDRMAAMVRIGLNQHRNNEEMIELRCNRGAEIVRKIGLGEQVAAAVRSLDEHWDGSGYPQRLRGEQIPLLARILGVAQHLDIFAQERGIESALATLQQRKGRWFDPQIVRAALSLHRRGVLWQQCATFSAGARAEQEQQTRAAVLDCAPNNLAQVDAGRLDQICEAFAEVVDAKSPFTFRHSLGVTEVTRLISAAIGMSAERSQFMYRAALLHDLGKLRVPNSILDKAGRLDADERTIIEEHPGLTRTILGRIACFSELADVAGAHHEKLDGTGYPDHRRAAELSQEARILAVADIYGALTEDRPYRPGFTAREALQIMERDVPGKLDPVCFEALRTAIAEPSLLPIPLPAAAVGQGLPPWPPLVAGWDPLAAGRGLRPTQQACSSLQTPQ